MRYPEAHRGGSGIFNRLLIPLCRKKDGTALYLTRDICELLGRVSTMLMKRLAAVY